MIVYTATDSVGHNSDAVLSQLCSEPLLIPLTRLPIESFHNLITLWSSISFIIPNEEKQESVSHISCSCCIPSEFGWCHVVSLGFVLDQLERSAIIWCHMGTCAPYPPFFPLN